MSIPDGLEPTPADLDRARHDMATMHPGGLAAILAFRAESLARELAAGNEHGVASDVRRIRALIAVRDGTAFLPGVTR